MLPFEEMSEWTDENLITASKGFSGAKNELLSSFGCFYYIPNFSPRVFLYSLPLVFHLLRGTA